jgi:hypothetical protein
VIWGWVVGLVFVLFPNQVWGFYRWLFGPDWERRNPYQKRTRGTRNAGIVWLVIMALITAFTWNQR